MMKLADKFPEGTKHAGRSLQTVLNADYNYVKFRIKKGNLQVSTYVEKTYNLTN